MVSGTDEHGTPIQVQADKEGVSARELADRYNRVIAEDLQGLGLSYDLFTRTTTRNHYAVVQELFRALHANGYVTERSQLSAIDPATGRGLPDRYVEGTCPICGYDGARGDQCDNCGNQLDPQDLRNPRSEDRRQAAEVRRERAVLPRAAGVRRRARQLAAEPHRLAAQRPEVQREPARGPAAAGDQPRPRLGRADPAAGLAGPPRQAALRVVRRRHRLPVGVGGVGPAHRRPPGVAAVLAGPGRRRRATSWARTTSSSTRSSGRASCSARAASRPVSPAAYGELELPGEVVSSEFLTMEGRKFSSSRSRRDLRPRRAGALRRRRAALLPGRGRPGDQRHRLHLGAVRHPQQHRAGRGLGQPGQPHRGDGGEERRRASPGPASCWPPTTRGAGRPPGPAFDPIGALLGRSQQKAALAEAMRVVGEANKYLSDQAPWKLKDDPARRESVLHVALQLVDDAKTLLTPFLPDSSETVHADARGRGHLERPAGAARGRGPRRRSGLPGADGGLRRPRRSGRAGRCGSARRWPGRCRCSPSSTRRSSTRSWPGWSRAREPADPQRTADDTPPPAPEPLAVQVLDSALPPRHHGRRRGRPPWPRRGPSASGPWCRSASTCRAAAWSAELAARYPQVHAAVALHPNEAGAGAATDEALREIEVLAALPQVVAVGETGLDHYRTESADGPPPPGGVLPGAHRDRQAAPARALVIHDRDAHDDVVRVLLDEGAPGPGGVPLLLRRGRAGPHLRRARLVRQLRRHGHLQERAGPARGGGGAAARSCCSSRPTRRSSPRCRTAGGRTPLPGAADGAGARRGHAAPRSTSCAPR